MVSDDSQHKDIENSCWSREYHEYWYIDTDTETLSLQNRRVTFHLVKSIALLSILTSYFQMLLIADR